MLEGYGPSPPLRVGRDLWKKMTLFIDLFYSEWFSFRLSEKNIIKLDYINIAFIDGKFMFFVGEM